MFIKTTIRVDSNKKDLGKKEGQISYWITGLSDAGCKGNQNRNSWIGRGNSNRPSPSTRKTYVHINPHFTL